MPVRLRLIYRITLVFVLFAALLLLAVGVSIYLIGRDALQRATTDELLAAALEKEAAMNAWIADNQSTLFILAQTLQKHNGQAALDNATRAQVLAELKDWVDAGGFPELLLLEPVTGRIIVDTDPGEVGKLKENEDFFVHGQTGPYVQAPFYSLNLQAPTMMVSRPIQAAGGSLWAVLAGRVDLRSLGAIIDRRTGVHETDSAFLVNSSNLFVTQPRFISDPAVLQRGNFTPLVNRCLGGESGTAAELDYRGLPVLAVYRWLPARQLCLVVQIDQAEAFAPTQIFRATLLAISGIGLLAGLALAVALARTITGPLRALQQGALRFGRGELDVRLPETSTDELGTLAREFNAMARSLADKDANLRNDATELLAANRQQIRELAERKRAEGRFQSLLEAAPDAIVIVNQRGEIVLVNSQTQRLFRYTRAQLLGRSVDLLVPDRFRGKHDLHRADYYSTPRVRAMGAGLELFGLRQDGTEFPVEISLSPLETDEGILVTAAVRDVTERKQADRAILRRNAELDALNQMGHALSRLAEPAELLELIFNVIGLVLDNQNLYIALYDDASHSISFPVYTINAKRVVRPARALGNGLTECMIRTRKPLFLPRDVANTAQALGVDPQGRPARCYLGVPMLAGDKVIGAIAVQDYEHEDVYDQAHLELLGTIAAQASVALENARLFAETRRRAEQLQAINDVEQAISTVLDPELLTARLVEVIHARLNLPNVGVGLIEGAELVFKPGRAAGERGLSDTDLRLKVGAEGITGRVALSGETILVPDVGLDPRFLRSADWPHTRSELAVALKTQAAVIGVLNLESDEVNAFSPELVSLMETLGSQIAQGIANARLFAETQRLARTDALTGLANRRYLFELGARELSRARRFGHPLAALMLDIDHFKQVNDTHGHAAGDQMLKIVARCFMTLVRDSDIVARYGGEEFVILLVETDLAGAHMLAERLRAEVARTVAVSDQGPLSVTISLGMTGARLESDELETLLARADSALYSAKQAGRNRVAAG